MIGQCSTLHPAYSAPAWRVGLWRLLDYRPQGRFDLAFHPITPDNVCHHQMDQGEISEFVIRPKIKTPPPPRNPTPPLPVIGIHSISVKGYCLPIRAHDCCAYMFRAITYEKEDPERGLQNALTGYFMKHRLDFLLSYSTQGREIKHTPREIALIYACSLCMQ